MLTFGERLQQEQKGPQTSKHQATAASKAKLGSSIGAEKGMEILPTLCRGFLALSLQARKGRTLMYQIELDKNDPWIRTAAEAKTDYITAATAFGADAASRARKREEIGENHIWMWNRWMKQLNEAVKAAAETRIKAAGGWLALRHCCGQAPLQATS